MKQYSEALKFILKNGKLRKDRTGVGTLGVFGYQMRFDLSKGFPAITTKKLAWKSVLSEAIWFLEGSGDEKRLKEILYGDRCSEKTTIWTANANAPYWKPKAKFEGDLGRVYGVNWRSWESTQYFDVEQCLEPEYLNSDLLNSTKEHVGGVGIWGNINYLDNYWVEMIKGEWVNMIHQFYGKPNPKKIHFTKEWLVFENFVKDFKSIPNWELKLEYPSSYILNCEVNATNRHSLSNSVFISFEELEMNKHTEYKNELGKMVVIKRRKHDQLKKLVASIKHDPYSRRLLLSSYNVGELEQMALPPCHTLAQFFVENGKLSCHLYQRSADMFLGVPFNIASYSLITHILADLCNLEVGHFIHTLGDAHIYSDHIEQVKTQLERKPFKLPKLKINRKLDIDNIEMKDFELLNYKHHASIAAKMAV